MKDREEYFMEIYNGRAFPDSKRPINSLYPSDFYPFLLFP